MTDQQKRKMGKTALFILSTSSNVIENISSVLNDKFINLIMINRNIVNGSHECRVYTNGRLETSYAWFNGLLFKREGSPRKAYPLLSLLLHFVIGPLSVAGNLLFLRKRFAYYDVLVAGSWIYAIIGLLFRKIHFVDKVIYWAFDWHPSTRQKEKYSALRLMISLFGQIMDRYCLEHCDATWDLSDGISYARIKRWKDGTIYNKKPHSVIYFVARSRSVGLHKCHPKTQRNMRNIVFIGRDKYLQDKMLYLLIDAIRSLKQRGLFYTLDVITGSNHVSSAKKQLIEYIAYSGLKDLVRVHGYLNDKEMNKILSSSLCGVAMFEGKDNISNYAFPGKVLLYFEHMLPVILSKDSAISQLVRETKAGIAVGPTVQEIQAAILTITKELDSYRAGVKEFVQKYMSGDRLCNALSAVLKRTQQE